MSKTKNTPNIIVYCFFAIYLALGLFAYKDYGISVDEPIERTTSIRQYKVAVSKLLSIFGQKSEIIGDIQYNQAILSEHRDRYYGSFLHWPLVFIEHLNNFELSNSQIFQQRHLNTFMHFYISVIFFYLLLNKRFKSKSIGLIGAGILIFSPRFFAESFYNNKDVLFFSWYLISLYFATWFLEKKNIFRGVVSAIMFGITINTRIIGFIIPATTFVISILQVTPKKQRFFSSRTINTFLMLFGSIIFYIFTMPTAWGNELNFLTQIFSVFSKYDWQGSTLYFGNLVPYNQIPWHFTLGYMFVTTPIWYGVLFCAGSYLFLKNLSKKFSKLSKSIKIQTDLLVLLSFILPFLTVIFTKAVIYNSWRHMYFIYGSFVYYCAYFLHHCKYKQIVFNITLISFIFTGAWMVKNHPYQYAYFNPLFRKSAAQNFERDYWGVSTLDLFDYILDQEKNNTHKIKIYQYDYGVTSIRFMLDQKEAGRFEFVPDQNQADYAIGWLYNTKKDISVPGFTEIKSTNVDSYKLMTLLKKD